jgi:salicylate hydroxylase
MHGVTDVSQIEERLALYEKIRRNRASSIQVLSNFGFDETAPPELAEFLDAEGQPMPGKFAFQIRPHTANQVSHQSRWAPWSSWHMAMIS